MAKKPREKMPISERAKQFMPFSALKGLDEALRKKEQTLIERRELTESEEAELNRILCSLKPHDKVTLSYYSMGRYESVSGEIADFDTAFRRMTIDGKKIYFDSIEKVEKNEKD